jgi:hypothetical protein
MQRIEYHRPITWQCHTVRRNFITSYWHIICISTTKGEQLFYNIQRKHHQHNFGMKCFYKCKELLGLRSHLDATPCSLAVSYQRVNNTTPPSFDTGTFELILSLIFIRQVCTTGTRINLISVSRGFPKSLQTVEVILPYLSTSLTFRNSSFILSFHFVQNGKLTESLNKV